VDIDEAPARAASGAAVAPSTGTLTPIAVGDVRITGGFWGSRQETNASATLAHCLRWMERLGWIANFDRVAAGHAGESAGREFADSEIYKLLEALAWEAARSTDDWAEETYGSLAERVLAAQQPDGYLNTRFGAPGQAPRYSDLEWGHELYCAGHFIQAAVARARTHGEDALVAAAIRLADHVCEVFGPDARDAICGHPEIEVALAELYRVTGDRRYLEQASLFVERRGRSTLIDPDVPPIYFVDDVPVRDADVLRGHAVRALYLAAGAADIAVENDDAALMDALRLQWRNTVARRTYLTGGMGARHDGESFGDDYELPSDRAYSETCAGVGSIMFSWRMLLASGDETYADLIERTLFNVIATSPDDAGTAFFYVNPLQRTVPGQETDPDQASSRAASNQRAPWFEVSCCPTNIARTIASLSGYFATVDEAGLQLHQYAQSSIRTQLRDGRRIALHVETDYPRSGSVAIVIDEEADSPWTLSVRIPGWAQGRATVTVAGDSRIARQPRESVTRRFRTGERIVLELPVEPTLSLPDERIDHLRGTAALEVGPLVYCLESAGNADLPLSELLLDPDAPLRYEPSDLTVTAQARLLSRAAGPYTDGSPAWPYGPAHEERTSIARGVEFTPYHQWAQRGPSTMRVFVPVADRPASPRDPLAPSDTPLGAPAHPEAAARPFREAP
jgi:DUF1680 family protein